MIYPPARCRRARGAGGKGAPMSRHCVVVGGLCGFPPLLTSTSAARAIMGSFIFIIHGFPLSSGDVDHPDLVRVPKSCMRMPNMRPSVPLGRPQAGKRLALLSAVGRAERRPGCVDQAVSLGLGILTAATNQMPCFKIPARYFSVNRDGTEAQRRWRVVPEPGRRRVCAGSNWGAME
jgi:hypothetical protein